MSPAGAAPPAVSRRAARGIVVVPGGLVGAATLSGFAGGRWWVFGLVDSFRPQLLAVAAMLALAAVAAGAFRTAAAMVVAAGLNLLVLGPYLTGFPALPAPEAGTLRIVSFNVGISNPSRPEVMDYLERLAPDVAVLVESSFEWEDAARSARLPLRPVAVVPPTYLSGITVLAAPQVGATSFEVPFAPDEAVGITLTGDGITVDLLAIHPPSPTTATRAGERDRLLASAGTWARQREAPVVVMGDFNATPWSHAVRTMRRAGGLVDSLAGRGLQPTWPDGWGPLMVPIDHALVSPQLAVVDRATGPGLGSAHRPLLVEIAPALGTLPGGAAGTTVVDRS